MLREVSVEIIRKCCNNCVHCSSESNKNCDEIMPFEKFKEIVEDAARLGAKTICLSGGEPFLHNRIPEMISFTRDAGLACFIYTSGVVCDSLGKMNAISKEVFSVISKEGVKIIFNIEAAHEDTYDAIMGTRGCFDVMLTSIRNAVSLGIVAEAHFVPMKLNSNEIEAVIELCRSLGITKVSFLRLVPHGRAKKHIKEIMLSDTDLEELKRKLVMLQEKTGSSIRIGVPLSLDMTCHKCEAAAGKLNIRYDGNVFPCEVFKNTPLTNSLGSLSPNNVYETSLYAIYQKSEYLRCVRNLSHGFSGVVNETCLGQYLIRQEGENNNE